MVKRTERKAFDEFTLAIKCPFISTCYPVNVCYFKWVNEKYARCDKQLMKNVIN